MLKIFNTKPIHLLRRGKCSLGSEPVFGLLYWQNTLEHEPFSPHTKVQSVLLAEGWAKAVGARWGGLCLAVVLLKVGLFLSHKVCKNFPMLCSWPAPNSMLCTLAADAGMWRSQGNY